MLDTARTLSIHQSRESFNLGVEFESELVLNLTAQSQATDKLFKNTSKRTYF